MSDKSELQSDHTHLLDIHDPEKWQMRVRLYLEACDPGEGEKWLDGIRLITEMAGRVVRDSIHRRSNARCFLCGGVFKDGKPAGGAGYYDAENKYIPIWCCEQSEYNDLLKAVTKKEHEVKATEARIEKAARQALVDARRAATAKEARG